MSVPRRYDEAEFAEILRRAVEASGEGEGHASPTAAREGLTLPEIQEVGGEVGIAPARIEAAARSLDRPPASPAGRFLGAPRSVSRTVPLDRAPDDDEWMRIVAMLRETFGARGEVESLGPIRTWYNGNLQVHIEPADIGQRLRMTTYKGNVDGVMTIAAVFLGMALLLGATIFLKRGLDPGLLMPLMFGLAGTGLLGGTRLMLPRWAEERTAQMEGLAERIPRLLAAPATERPTAPTADPPTA